MPREPGGLDDAEILTQYVFQGAVALDIPRPRDMDGLSLLRGRLTTREAARFVRGAKWPSPGDGVRHIQTKTLRAAGFEIRSTPNKRNPLHVSVSREAQWGQAEGALFDGCCSDVKFVEGGGPNG